MMKFRMRRTNTKVLLILAILVFGVFIRIGYALLSQDLTIGGLAIASKTVWGVHFVENSIVEDFTHLDSCSNGDECSSILKHATIEQDGKSISFGLTFHAVDDYYEFTVDVINDGTIDAMLNEVIKEGLTGNSEYLDFTVTYSDGMPIAQYDQLLKNGGTETLKVKVKCISELENDLDVNLGLTANYIKGNNNMQSRSYDPETMIRSLNTLGTSIADDDPDNNLRFIGANPNNYVRFNNQTWRIIGIFDGKLKLVQNSIGNYSWDTSKNDINNGYGINQWGPNNSGYTGAAIMRLLNPGYETNSDLKCNTATTITDGVANCGDNTDSNYSIGLVNNSLYWTASSGKCYTAGNYNVADCNFSSIGLSDTKSKNMIDDATWYLGSNDLPSENIWDGRITASVLYNWERSDNSSKQCESGTACTDTVERTTTWQGKVGLIYPSDYAYATAGGNTYQRSDCLSYTVGYVNREGLNNWSNAYTECMNNDWLLPASGLAWTITPRAFGSSSNGVLYVYSTGYINQNSAKNTGSIRPTVYLKPGVVFTNEGDGRYDTPFVLRNLSNVHIVTFDANGGIITPTTKEVDNGSNIGTLPTPTAPTGKTFDGWYTEVSGGTKITSSYIPTGNVTVYAHWTQVYDPETRIRSLNTLNTSIADDDPDSNLRFIGTNPNNYVSFNNQKWRIIGVFDGKLKLVSPSIGAYSYDSSMYNVNNGHGVNAWEASDLMKLLNPGYSTNTDYKCIGSYSDSTCGSNASSDFEEALVNNSLYWDGGQGLCYDYADLRVKSCDFRSSGLTDENSKAMIDNATWYLGSNPVADDLFGANQITTASYLYNIERSNNTGKQCSSGAYCTDQVPRNNPPTWTGKVGLLYPSDYAYATSGDLTGSGTDRATCLSKQVGYVSASTTPNWSNTYTDCHSNDWLYTGSTTWFLSPRAYSSHSSTLFIVNSTGVVDIYHAKNAFAVRPTVYLKSSVKIVGTGTGTYDNPFVLKIIE